MKKTKKVSLGIILTVLTAVFLCFGVSAKTYGDYKYDVVSCEDCYDEDGDYIEGHVCEKSVVITGYKGEAKSLKIPSEIDGKKVKGVDEDAFSGQEKLKSVTLPSTVSKLSYKAFGDCTSLESINIPENVKSISPFAFDNCHKLTNISVSSDNKSFSVNKAGVIFNKAKTELLMYPAGKSKTSFTVPDKVKTVGPYAFADFVNLTTVKLPSGLSRISEFAFYGCTDLKNATLPGSLKRIDYYAFTYCTSLKSVTVPKKANECESGIFKGCTGLESAKFASGVTSVPDSIFENCTNLKTVTLPESITNIYGSAFEGCTNLKNITIPKNVEYIGDHAFEDCVSLKSVSIPKKVETIAWSAFNNCTSLETVTLAKGIETISSSAFAGCTSLKKITIPDSVHYFGGSVFAGCTSLASVKLSNGMEDLFDGIFENCTSLKSITIPENVSLIFDSVFEGCTSLSEFKVNSKNKHFSVDKYGVLFNKNKTTLVRYPAGNKNKSYTIPKNVESIVCTAFNDCMNLEKFAAASSNKYFSADKNGILFSKNKKELVRYPAGKQGTSYTISSKVKTTADNAFYGCTSLEEVNIPDGFEFIGYNAFSKCTALKSIKIPNNVETLVYLPRFVDCTSLESVSLPSTLQSIDYNAFTGCSDLEEIKVSSKNKNFSSDSDGVFYNRDKTILYMYPQGKKITAYAVRDGVKGISSVAFYEAVNLKSIFIPDSIENERLQPYMFDYCTSLKDIYYEGTKKEWKDLFTWDTPELPGVKIHYEHKHTYKTVTSELATVEDSGKIISQCVCGKINPKKDAVTVYKIKSIKLSETEFTYNGKSKTPSVVIKDTKGNVLKKNKDYTLKYSEGRMKPGKYTVTVTFKGKYSGTEKLTFTIIPTKVTISKVTAGSKSATVAWQKHPNVTGYEVSYSTSSKFKSAKKASVTGASTKKMTIKKLAKGKKYFFKVRAYKSVNGTKIYGGYSAVKSAVIK